jgi:hypothetical protein
VKISIKGWTKKIQKNNIFGQTFQVLAKKYKKWSNKLPLHPPQSPPGIMNG